MPSGFKVVPCSDPECSRTDIKAKGLCGTHYDRQWAAEKRPPVLRVLAKDMQCRTAGCPDLVGNGSHGYCPSHARKYLRGTLDADPRVSPTHDGTCPVCNNFRKLDRNLPPDLRVCQSCYRAAKKPEGWVPKKPGPKPQPEKEHSRYSKRDRCPQGHEYVEGSYTTDDLGRRYCQVCFQDRRKTHCPQGHAYSEENIYIVNGSPQCRICRNKRMRDRRPVTVGKGGRNAAKTHCPHGHEYTPENTLWSKDNRRSCKTCAHLNGRVQNLRRFSLTLDQLDAMLKAQDSKCAVCRRPLKIDAKDMHIDHNHKCCDGPYSCGKCVRGLLCKFCNPGLGYFADDPALLRAAADYLDSYAAVMS